MRQVAAIVFCIFSLSSCSTLMDSYSNHYFPVINREQRESTLGFSIAPPSGADWYEKVNDNSLYYLKKIDSENYAIYTKATEIHLDKEPLRKEDFLQFVQNEKQLDTKSRDFRNVTTKFKSDHRLAPLCVRYIQGYDDYGPKNKQHADFIRVQKSGLFCMHPESPKDGIDMFYVESFRQSLAENHNYAEEGEVFLNSLQFKRKGG